MSFVKLILGGVWDYLPMFLMLTLGIGVVYYVQNYGALRVQNEALATQIKDLKDDKETLNKTLQGWQAAYEAAEAARTQQMKDVSNARKKVADSYRNGAVPPGVSKFYVDTPAAASLPRCL